MVKKDYFQLYQLTDDNEERNDLALTNPEKLEELKKILLSELDSEKYDLKIINSIP